MLGIAKLHGAVFIRIQSAAFQIALIVQNGEHGHHTAEPLAYRHIKATVVIAAILPGPVGHIQHSAVGQGDGRHVDAELHDGLQIAGGLRVGQLSGEEIAAGFQQQSGFLSIYAEHINAGAGFQRAALQHIVGSHFFKGLAGDMQLDDSGSVFRIANQQSGHIEVGFPVDYGPGYAVGVAHIVNQLIPGGGLGHLNSFARIQIRAPQGGRLPQMIVGGITGGLGGGFQLDGIGVIPGNAHTGQIRHLLAIDGYIRHLGHMGVGGVVGVNRGGGGVQRCAVDSDVCLGNGIKIAVCCRRTAVIGAAINGNGAVHELGAVVGNGNGVSLAGGGVAGKGAVAPVDNSPAGALLAAAVGQAQSAAVGSCILGEGAAFHGAGGLACAEGVEANGPAYACRLAGHGVVVECAILKGSGGVGHISGSAALVGCGGSGFVAGELNAGGGHGVFIQQVDSTAVGSGGVAGEAAAVQGKRNTILDSVNGTAGFGGVVFKAGVRSFQRAGGKIDSAAGAGGNGVL